MDTKDCAYCKIDFVPTHGSQIFCKTSACKRDRAHESNDRLMKKVPNKPGYSYKYGQDVTTIRPNGWAMGGGGKKKSTEGDEL